MSEDLIAKLNAHSGSVPRGPLRDAIRDAADRIAYLEQRLEVVPDFSEDADGIACRNDTIALQDKRIATLEAREAEIERLTALLATADSDREMAVDNAATFCIEHLAKMLGDPDYVASDGSEEWEGDVAGTINNVLTAARVLDPWDWLVARHEKFYEERAALQSGAGDEGVGR